jgi:hypothetical protein
MQKKMSTGITRSQAQVWRALVCALCLAVAVPASAATINVPLGNTASGLVTGAEATIFDVIAAQDGQPAPFGQGYGDDSAADPDNFAATWTFIFAPIAGPISAASIVLGMVDADAGSPGDQVDFFSVAGSDLTGAANTAFNSLGESANGDSGIYQVYSIDLAGILASLAGGNVSVTLRLKGPVVNPVLFGVPPDDFVTENFNGAHLIFSTLSMTTESTSVPEPGSLLLLGLGLPLMFVARRRANRVRPI